MNSNNIIESINLLPEDVVLYEIFPNLKNELLAVLNKKYYTKFHTCLRNKIPNDKYEGYIRRMVRHDHFFAQHILLLSVFTLFPANRRDSGPSSDLFDFKSIEDGL